MPAICADCGHSTTRYTTKFNPGGIKTTCYSCEHPAHSDLTVAKSIFHGEGLTLEHVTDEFGKPLRVTSLRELREAEKKYHFRSVVGNEDEGNFDRKPPPKPTDPFEVMTREKKWLYPEVAESMLKEMRANGELVEKPLDKMYRRPHQAQ